MFCAAAATAFECDACNALICRRNSDSRSEGAGCRGRV
jgi:hypothetical protein